LEVGIARFFLCPDSDFWWKVIADPVDVLHCRRKSEMSEYILDTIEIFLNRLLPSMGLELFEIQFRREGHGWVLRVFIDAEKGVTLEDCSKVSRELSHYLDIEDLIDHAYHLEVSSPGLERPLRSADDFIRFLGKSARVKLSERIEGQKVFEGIIEEVDGSDILLKLEDQSSVKFSFDMINKARLTI
jgi:ribosome maturation factor RimP